MDKNQSQLITVIFQDGPLGVTLRRRSKDGVVFVHDIIENSQAVNMNINIDDELWAIGQSEIGDVALDKDAWKGLVEFIRFSPRPLKAVWKRYSNETEDSIELDEVGEEILPEQNEDSSNGEITVNLQEALLKKEKNVSSIRNAVSKIPPPKPSKFLKPTSEPSSTFPHPSSSSFKTSTPRSIENIRTKESISRLSVSSPSSDLLDSSSELAELSSRLVLKDKEKSKFANGFIAHSKRSIDNSIDLVKDGRQIVRIGELEITSKASLAIFDKQNKRQFILLTDTLIVAIPIGNQIQVENMIDLQVCFVLFLIFPFINRF